MKVLVLDDGRKQATPISDAFFKKRIDAIVCVTSNDFMTALNTSDFDKMFINAETWNRGRCIYDYFGAGPRLEGKPAVFYNADERFANIANRKPHENDRVFPQPSDIEAAMAAM